MVHPPRPAGRAVQALRLGLAACLPALAACTINFTPGDAKPAVYTPYPAPATPAASAAAPAAGQGVRSGPGTAQ